LPIRAILCAKEHAVEFQGAKAGGGVSGRQQTIRQEAADEFEFVTRQRDILKKALGILGQDPWNSSK
jgi:hypothetical protein